jgi:hypothetical protein
MNPTTVGELKAKLSEYADDELVLLKGHQGYLVICGTSEGMN